MQSGSSSGGGGSSHFRREGGAQLFKGRQVETLKEAKTAAADPSRVVKVDRPRQNDVGEYQLPPLGKLVAHDYATVREKFGPFAVTDDKRSHLSQKDRRFEINPSLRGSLSIDSEERRVVEERVQEQLKGRSDEARKTGHQEGYAAGLEKGYSEAFARFREEAATRLQALEGMLAQIDGMKQELSQANERLLLELLYRAGRMILLRELAADPEYVRRLVLELIDRTSAKDSIRVQVCPEDFATVSMLSEKLATPGSPYRNIRFEPSTQVPRGGARVETDWETLEATVESQLETIHQALIAGGGSAAGNTAEPGRSA